MRRACMLTALLLLLPVMAQAAPAAMKGEPKQFRGMVFGQEYKPGPEFTCQTDSEEATMCTRAGEDMTFCGVPLRSLTYLFMYKRFYTVDMEVEGRDHYEKILAELTRLHGNPMARSGRTFYFLGKSVDIMLYYDEPRHTGAVAYVYKNLPCPVGE